MRLDVLLCVVVMVLVGCAHKARRGYEEVRSYRRILFMWERLPEVARAIEHRRAGHNWRAVAYSSHRYNEQREALKNAIKEFREAVNWYILARRNHPRYRNVIEHEIDAVYKYIILCRKEMPERPPEAPLSRWERQELQVLLERARLAREIGSWDVEGR